ncbi:MAG: hypothetical protein IPO00_11235 [Betaproteobacteria bacterium]|nr:hypothetical protein [Betaproteobacteria bacterium]
MPGQDNTLPAIILTQRRIFILPTRAGLLFRMALAVMLIGAIIRTSAWSRPGFPARRIRFGRHGAHVPQLARPGNLTGTSDAGAAGEIAYFSLHLPTNVAKQTCPEFPLRKGNEATLDVPQLEAQASTSPARQASGGRFWPDHLVTTRYLLAFLRVSYPHPRLSCLVYHATHSSGHCCHR